MPSLFTHLEQAEEKADALAFGIATVMKQYYFVASVYLLSDIQPHLSRLSELFQQRSIDFSQLHTHISNSISVLETLKNQDGPNLKKLETVFTAELSSCRITVEEKDPENFQKNVWEAYINAIIANLKSRFPDMAIITSFGIFDPSQIPAKSSSERIN